MKLNNNALLCVALRRGASEHVLMIAHKSNIQTDVLF